jgi:hypothetical protein
MTTRQLARQIGTADANNMDEDYTLGWLGFDDSAIDLLEEHGIAFGSFRWMLAEWFAKRAFNRAVNELRKTLRDN